MSDARKTVPMARTGPTRPADRYWIEVDEVATGRPVARARHDAPATRLRIVNGQGTLAAVIIRALKTTSPVATAIGGQARNRRRAKAV